MGHHPGRRLGATEASAVVNIEDLPAYQFCDVCPERHFLTVNRDDHGAWSVAYVNYVDFGAVQGLALNNCSTLDEAAARMQAAIKRRERRVKRDL